MGLVCPGAEKAHGGVYEVSTATMVCQMLPRNHSGELPHRISEGRLPPSLFPVARARGSRATEGEQACQGVCWPSNAPGYFDKI